MIQNFRQSKLLWGQGIQVGHKGSYTCLTHNHIMILYYPFHHQFVVFFCFFFPCFLFRTQNSPHVSFSQSYKICQLCSTETSPPSFLALSFLEIEKTDQKEALYKLSFLCVFQWHYMCSRIYNTYNTHFIYMIIIPPSIHCTLILSYHHI